MRKVLFLLFLFLSNQETSTAAINLLINGGIVPTSMFQGKTYNVTYYVQNTGSSSTSVSFYVSVFISPNPTFSSGTATYLTDIFVSGGIAANSTKTVSGQISIPSGYSTGTKYIIAGADATNLIAESNEGDNNFSLSILLKACPLTTPVSLSPGGTVSSPAIINTTTPTFQWSAVTHATCYGVYIKNAVTDVLIYDNNAATTSNSFTVPSGLLTAGGLYKWNCKAKSDCSETGCISGFSTAVYFTINSPCSIPAIPPLPTSNSPQGGSVTLFRSGSPPAGESWYWQNTSCGTSTSYGSGSTFTANATGTYYLRSLNTCGNWSSGCAAVNVTVYPVPANPPDPTSNSPQPNSVTITRSGNPQAGETWYWQNTNCGTNTSLGSGSTFIATSSNTYYIRALNSFGVWSMGCGGVAVNVTNIQYGNVSVNITPTAAVTAGAQWNIDGGGWQNSGIVIPNITTGAHTINFKPVSGWNTPSSQNVIVTQNNTVNATGTYTLAGSPPTINTFTATNQILDHSTIPVLHTLYTGTPYTTSDPIKICADGSQATFFKVNASNITGLSFRLLDENNLPINNTEKYGSLGTPISFGNNLEVPYTHPQYMDANGLYRTLTLQIIYNGSPVSGINFPIRIFRAPLLFVHGLWGNASTFSDMEDSLLNRNMYPPYENILYYTFTTHSPLTQRGDYESDHASSFLHNSMYMHLFIS